MLERVLAQPLAAFTPRTIVEPRALRAELRAIRERGYAVDYQEMVMGVFCIGVPIVDRSGRPVGAISISGPTRKQAGPEVEPLVDLLNDATGKVSRRLGYTGPWPPQPAERPLEAAE